MTGSPRTVAVNGAFWPQPVTGQQRYAREMVAHLEPAGVPVLRPGGRWAASRSQTWAWTQTRLPVAARRDVLVSLTSRVPVAHPRQVVTVHDLFTLTNPEWFSPRYLAVKRPLLRHLLRSAAGILAVSAPVRDQVRHLGLTPAHVPVVLAPNAAGAAFRRDVPDRELPFPRGRDGSGFVLAVGSLEPRKNLARLLEAHRRLHPDLRREHPLVLVGSSAAIFDDPGLRVRQDDPHVHLTGFLPDDVLATAYRRATVVVMPSLAEGFGLPLVEALHCGARVVASDIPVFRWVAGDAVTYADPLDVADLARALAAAVTGEETATGALPRTYDYAVSARAALELARQLAG